MGLCHESSENTRHGESRAVLPQRGGHGGDNNHSTRHERQSSQRLLSIESATGTRKMHDLNSALPQYQNTDPSIVDGKKKRCQMGYITSPKSNAYNVEKTGFEAQSLSLQCATVFNPLLIL